MAYHIEFTDKAQADIQTLRKLGDRAALKKILKLLDEISEAPFSGTGKPEPLKNNLSGCWSRRINKEHRLVYEVENNTVFILSAVGHYY